MRRPKDGSTPPTAPPPVAPGDPGPGKTRPHSPAPPEPPRFDLSRYSEATRRAVWDSLAAHHFGATAEEAREAEADDDWVETHSADEAGLVVFYLHGRWLAWWRMLDEPEGAPDRFLYDVVSLHEDPGQASGLGLSEV